MPSYHCGRMQRDMHAERMRSKNAHGKTRESHMRPAAGANITLLLMVRAYPSQHTAYSDLERKCPHPVECGDEHTDRI